VPESEWFERPPGPPLRFATLEQQIAVMQFQLNNLLQEALDRSLRLVSKIHMRHAGVLGAFQRADYVAVDFHGHRAA